MLARVAAQTARHETTKPGSISFQVARKVCAGTQMLTADPALNNMINIDNVADAASLAGAAPGFTEVSNQGFQLIV